MRVLILRPEELLHETVELLRKEGFEAYGCPFVKLVYNEFEIPEHEYAIVTSQNAARALVERGARLGKVIAIGKKTAEVLEKGGYEVVKPTKFDSETLYMEFSETVRGKKVVAFRSDAGSDVLRRLGEIADFREIEVYRIDKLQGEDQRREVERVKSGFYDVIVFSSSMIAKSFLELCPPEYLHRVWLIAIGPPTARVLESYGLKPLIPDEYTFDGVLQLLRSLRDGDFQR